MGMKGRSLGRKGRKKRGLWWGGLGRVTGGEQTPPCLSHHHDAPPQALPGTPNPLGMVSRHKERTWMKNGGGDAGRRKASHA